MKELKTLSISFSANIFLRKPVILGEKLRHVLHAKGIVFLFIRHNGLHGNLLKSLVGQMNHIFGKVRIVAGIRAPHIIVHLVSALGRLLILRQNLVIAALPAPMGPHEIMNLLPAVDAQDQIRHFLIYKVHNFVGQQYAVGGKRKTEFLMVRLLQRSAVSYQLLHHLPVHEGLPAKEIHLQIDTVPGIFHQKIQRLPAHLKTHQRPSAVVFALPCKAVFTGQITVVGNVQAERFHHGLPLRKRIYIVFVNVLGKKLSRFFQGKKFLRQFPCFGMGQGKLLLKCLRNYLLILRPLCNQPLHHGNRIISGPVHHMHAAAVDIHHNMISIINIPVYHKFFSLSVTLIPQCRPVMRRMSSLPEYPIIFTAFCRLKTYLAFSQLWLPTVQEVLQAD